MSSLKPTRPAFKLVALKEYPNQIFDFKFGFAFDFAFKLEFTLEDEFDFNFTFAFELEQLNFGRITEDQ